jgi:hypothetical protein
MLATLTYRYFLASTTLVLALIDATGAEICAKDKCQVLYRYTVPTVQS